MLEDFSNFIPLSGEVLETCEPWSWSHVVHCCGQVSWVSCQVTICPIGYAHGFAVHCSVMVIFWVTNGFLWSAYSYPLGSLHWHWGNCQGHLGASEVFLKIWNWPLKLQTSPNDDVMTWKWSLHYWPFVRGIRWSSVDFPHKGPVIWILWSFFPLILV